MSNKRVQYIAACFLGLISSNSIAAEVPIDQLKHISVVDPCKLLAKWESFGVTLGYSVYENAYNNDGLRPESELDKWYKKLFGPQKDSLKLNKVR